MKWVLFLLSLLALFFANNVLFWLPGRYDWFTFVAGGIAIAAAVVLAWFSSRKFAASAAGASISIRNILMAPPAVICLFVLFLFCAIGVLKIVAYWGS